ncbi:MAG: hypothetical protein IJZ96_05280 [Lachnospiraceae bacterium]|nr:hypothetical protein [Lachnospiraceae bacterium]MBQ8166435.1 hypothetical protein [Lachnospiraceae bacterium]
MKKWQIYPSAALADAVTKDAEEKGISISAALVEALEKAYGITGENEEMSMTDVLSKIQLEVEEFIADQLANPEFAILEFTLYKASETFAEISMGDPNGRLVAMKPRLGKAFRKLVDDKTIKHVIPARKPNGEQKREHNAAVYRIVKED